VKGKERLIFADVEQALLDPGSVFDSPEELLVAEGLSREQRIAILRRWEYDASEVSVAVEEGMPGGNADLVHRILLALGKLGAAVDVERVGPTKQHGIPD
jgi:hypothetical protein